MFVNKKNIFFGLSDYKNSSGLSVFSDFRTFPTINNMKKGRLEAFSDGVIAIIITIMVLDLKVPHGDNISALLPMIPGIF